MNNRPGFTIAEVLIAFIIVIFLALLTAGVTGRAVKYNEFDRVKEALRSELFTAQADTVAGTLDSSWGVAVFENGITRYRGSSYAARVTTFDRTTTFNRSVSATGTPDIPFTRPYGLPLQTALVVVTDGTHTATTTVSASGNIIIE